MESIKRCMGCQNEYDDGVWLHEELGICSICYNIHHHSKIKKWDSKNKKWIKKKKNKTIERWL